MHMRGSVPKQNTTGTHVLGRIATLGAECSSWARVQARRDRDRMQCVCGKCGGGVSSMGVAWLLSRVRSSHYHAGPPSPFPGTINAMLSAYQQGGFQTCHATTPTTSATSCDPPELFLHYFPHFATNIYKQLNYILIPPWLPNMHG